MALILLILNPLIGIRHIIFEDVRNVYSESRFIAYGYIHARFAVVVYTMRGDNLRIISLRKANKREVNQYGY